ncbi:MAG: hypothetical protein AMJ43_07885 [Coxiella sp. DG_40]|nr:MAG: hypothetical protein AMJ43_07885 [Coxiella sp. DG_40]
MIKLICRTISIVFEALFFALFRNFLNMDLLQQSQYSRDLKNRIQNLEYELNEKIKEYDNK